MSNRGYSHRGARAGSNHGGIGFESGNLDILRAAAVLLVLVCHISWTLTPARSEFANFGLCGVLLFFVHTSLVLFMSLRRSGGGPVPFYIRRLFRIYPLSIFTVVIFAAFKIPPSTWTKFAAPQWPQILSNLLLLQNITGHDSLVGPLWTLPFEVQMYAVLPFIFLLARIRHASSLVVGGAVALAIGEMVLTGASRLFQWYPCFAAGFVAFQSSNRRRTLRSYWLFIAIALFAVICCRLDRPSISGSVMLAGFWACCLALGAALPMVQEVRSRGITVPAKYIAKYSYGIYLTHTLALHLAFRVWTDKPAPLRYAAFVTLLVALPAAVYHVLEEPAIEMGRILAARYNRRRLTLTPLVTPSLQPPLCRSEANLPKI